MEQIETLLGEAREKVSTCVSLDDLLKLESSFLGKKGSLTSLLKSIREIPADERKTFGNLVNQAKESVKGIIDEKKKTIIKAELDTPVDFDVTMPGTKVQHGSIHPILQTMDDLNEAFRTLGFQIFEGPEISSEAYAFDNLNFPADHPARESMDTYWLENGHDKNGASRLCLRPHLTGASVRFMQENKPPFRFVYPGRVYRSESTDASHERAFFQYEALMIDKKYRLALGA